MPHRLATAHSVGTKHKLRLKRVTLNMLKRIGALFAALSIIGGVALGLLMVVLWYLMWFALLAMGVIAMYRWLF